MISAHIRRPVASRAELLPELRNADRGVEPQPGCLVEREWFRALAECDVRRERPAAVDVELLREDDALDGVHVQRVHLPDGELADVGELPSSGEAEDGPPFVDCLRFVGAIAPEMT